MPKPRPKTNAQNARMFGLATPKAKAAGIDPHDYICDIVFVVTGEKKSGIRSLTFDEANDVIKILGGDPIPAYGNSYRSQNLRKQRAGIKTIETDAHLQKIVEIANALGWDESRLRGFCNRQIKRDAPSTTEEGNKVLEGLKAIAKREGVLPFRSRRNAGGSPAQPKFRRVA